MDENNLNNTGMPEGADAAADQINNTAAEAGNAANSVADSITDTVANAVNTVGETADNVADKVVDAVSDIAGDVKDAISGGADNAANTANAFNNPEPAIKPDAVYTNNGFNAAPEQEGSKALAIVSLVLGIVSILAGCCCGLCGAPVPIAAIITGVIAKVKKKPGSGMALAGIITGAVGLVVAIVMVIVGIASGNSTSFMKGFSEGLNGK